MKQIEATILGHSYKLACPPDGEQMLQQAVSIVDREMCAIRDAGKMKARERIAVLTALNLAYQRVEQAQNVRAVAPSAAAAGSAVSPANAQPSAAVPEADGQRIAALIQRIDMALGDDGMLL